MIAFNSPLSDRLAAIVEDYIDAHDLCLKQQGRLRLHVRRFDEWKGEQSRDEAIGDVGRINKWLASVTVAHAPATVNGYRTSILTLLRFASPDDEPLIRTDRIRRQREPEKIKLAFTRDEILTLIAAAPRYWPVTNRVFGRGLAGDTKPRHRPDGAPWSIWWEAFTRAGYDSGQYLADLRTVRWGDVAPDGTVTLSRHKTGRLLSFRLRPETIRAARRIGNKEFVLPWDYDMRAYFAREWRKFVRFAGVRELGAKSLRRSAITYTYIEQGPEAARILAGHASFATTSRNYIDWSIARRPVVQPPPLQ